MRHPILILDVAAFTFHTLSGLVGVADNQRIKMMSFKDLTTRAAAALKENDADAPKKEVTSKGQDTVPEKPKPKPQN